MRKSRMHDWMMVLVGCGIVSLAGCSMSLNEAAEAGLFDFITGTITDTLTALVPIADAITNTAG